MTGKRRVGLSSDLRLDTGFRQYDGNIETRPGLIKVPS